jgi:hypothetical protein
MAADGVRFPIEAVHRHAGSVQGVADAVGQARAAVHEVSMDRQAYGQLCQFLPGMLEPVFTAAVAALGDSVNALQETALGLHAVADSTQATDTAGAQRITTAGPGGLPELPL